MKDYIGNGKDRRRNTRSKLWRKGSKLNFLFTPIEIPSSVKGILLFVVGMYFWLVLLFLEMITVGNY